MTVVSQNAAQPLKRYLFGFITKMDIISFTY